MYLNSNIDLHSPSQPSLFYNARIPISSRNSVDIRRIELPNPKKSNKTKQLKYKDIALRYNGKIASSESIPKDIPEVSNERILISKKIMTDYSSFLKIKQQIKENKEGSMIKDLTLSNPNELKNNNKQVITLLLKQKLGNDFMIKKKWLNAQKSIKRQNTSEKPKFEGFFNSKPKKEREIKPPTTIDNTKNDSKNPDIFSIKDLNFVHYDGDNENYIKNDIDLEELTNTILKIEEQSNKQNKIYSEKKLQKINSKINELKLEIKQLKMKAQLQKDLSSPDLSLAKSTISPEKSSPRKKNLKLLKNNNKGESKNIEFPNMSVIIDVDNLDNITESPDQNYIASTAFLNPRKFTEEAISTERLSSGIYNFPSFPTEDSENLFEKYNVNKAITIADITDDKINKSIDNGSIKTRPNIQSQYDLQEPMSIGNIESMRHIQSTRTLTNTSSKILATLPNLIKIKEKETSHRFMHHKYSKSQKNLKIASPRLTLPNKESLPNTSRSSKAILADISTTFLTPRLEPSKLNSPNKQRSSARIPSICNTQTDPDTNEVFTSDEQRTNSIYLSNDLKKSIKKSLQAMKQNLPNFTFKHLKTKEGREVSLNMEVLREMCKGEMKSNDKIKRKIGISVKKLSEFYDDITSKNNEFQKNLRKDIAVTTEIH